MMEKKLPSRIRKKRNLKIKKSTIGVFVAVFAFVFSIFQAFAGTNPTIIMDKIESASVGDTVTMNVSLENDKDYTSLGFTVNFDPSKLEFVPTGSKALSASGDDDEAPEFDTHMLTTNEAANGRLMFAFVFLTGGTANTDATLGRVKFRVKDGAVGQNDVTISNIKMELMNPDETVTSYDVDKEDGYIKVAVPVDPNSVALEEDEFEIQKGSTATLVVTYEPENTTDPMNAQYASSATNVATVSDSGVITAVAPGNATITVTAFGQELTATVTVVNHITGVTLTAPTTEINKSGTVQVSATITPDDTSDDTTLVWASSATNVATVDQTGKVTAVGGGTTTITATSTNNVVGSINISVVVPITEFTTTDTSVNMEKGDTHTIPVTITPNDTTESTTITWVSSATTVATINASGVVTAVGAGNATITGTLPNNMSITVPVTVTVPLVSISLDKDNIELVPEQTQTLELTINPDDTTDTNPVVWESSSTAVATVNNGTVTAVAPGNATITVTKGSQTATATVHVLKAIDSIVISQPEVTLNRNASATLTAIITPNDAEEDKTVTWTSSDPTSVSVTQQGVITGLKGTQNPVTITAELPNGMSATSQVTVVVLLDDISLNKSSATLNRGETETLTVSYDPEDTSEDTTVTWESSATNVATVSNGTVTAVGPGTAVITATVGTHSKVCTITVLVPIESVTVPDADFTLNRGATKTVSATVNPSDTTEDTTVTWTSSATNVATVDSTGKVTAVSAGTATITATAGGKSDTVKVTVVVPITEFTASSATMEIVKNTSQTISTTINPTDTTEDTTITWTSSATNIATVDANGKVTGKAAGSATITGTLPNDMQVQVVVTVTIIPVESITISQKNIPLLRKDTVGLSVTYSPENATEVTDVTWESSDTTVATVDADGKVTALKEGSATITARMGQLTDTANVTVTEVALEGISLEGNSTTTEVGADYILKPVLEPADATDDVTYTYESSDPEIAEVDPTTGKLITKKAGTVTITIKASNGNEEYEDTITITVNTPSSPQTGVTPIWVYGGIIAILSIIAVVICKKKELF